MELFFTDAACGFPMGFLGGRTRDTGLLAVVGTQHEGDTLINTQEQHLWGKADNCPLKLEMLTR